MAKVIYTQKEEFKNSLIGEPLKIPLIPINDLLINVEVLNKDKEEFILEFRFYGETNNFLPYKQQFSKTFNRGNVVLKAIEKNQNIPIQNVEIILRSAKGYKPILNITPMQR